MELSKSTEFYKRNWQIKIADENGYRSKYQHTPIEMIKFAEKYYQHRLSNPDDSDKNPVIDGIDSESNCDYRNQECTNEGKIIGGKWVCSKRTVVCGYVYDAKLGINQVVHLDGCVCNKEVD